MICNHEIETMPRPQLTALQTARLQKEIRWAYEKSAFYREMMEKERLTPDDIQTLDDLQKLPFTTKKELLGRSPFDFLTGPLSSALRVYSAGQGAERRMVRICSNGDVGRTVEMTARALVAGGVNRASVIKIGSSCPDASMLDIQYAAELIGATVLPSDGTELGQQLKMIDLLSANVLISDAPGLLRLLVAAQALQYDLKAKISTLFCVNSELTNTMVSHLGKRYEADLFNIYTPIKSGNTAMFYGCERHKALHLQEDYYYAEIISMQDESVIHDGSMGELVVTSLAAEAMPFFRYRTGRIVSMDISPCECGRTFAKITTL